MIQQDDVRWLSEDDEKWIAEREKVIDAALKESGRYESEQYKLGPLEKRWPEVMRRYQKAGWYAWLQTINGLVAQIYIKHPGLLYPSDSPSNHD